MAYSLSDGRLLEQTRVEDHLFARLDSLDPLAGGQVRVCRVHQSGGNECWFACDVGREVRAIKDMVGEKRLDERSVLRIDLGCGWASKKLVEGLIAGSKECDVGQTRQLLHDLWEETKVLCQVGKIRIAVNGSRQIHCLRSSQ